MPGLKKKNLRLATKERALASSEKVLMEEAKFILVWILDERPVELMRKLTIS